MKHTAQDILSILDECSETCRFPMLDNGYVYLAASRVSLYRSDEDWALTVEVFGFSPRSGIPDTQVYTFGSRITRQKASADFVSNQAYEAYLANNQYNESVFVYPIDDEDWQDQDDQELVANSASSVKVRGVVRTLPTPSEYDRFGISLQDPPTVRVFELCRLLAAIARNDVLATPDEGRTCVPSELDEMLVLDDWHHPDLVNGETPSANESFRAFAQVLACRDVSLYQPNEKSNTHWSNWPEGGSL
jgi:hypothetical protein